MVCVPMHPVPMHPSPMNTTEETLYGDLAFFHTHPIHLAALAGFCGLEPPALDQCRVLDVGCGTGFNLIAMSRTLPRATFVGVDLSPNQIEWGRNIAKMVGASRIELHACPLQELDANIGQFDFIIAHGLFSWVPEEVQIALLKLFRNHLTPKGIGYISYNTYPGWHFRNMLRDLFLHFEPQEKSNEERVKNAKESIQEFIDSLPKTNLAYVQALQSEWKEIKGEEDYYLLYEFLAELNQPIHFKDFAVQLANCGLQYLAESRFGTNSFAMFGTDREALDASGDDLIRREQHQDYRWQRYFRQTLITHHEQVIPRSPNVEIVKQFWVHSHVQLVEPLADLGATEFDTAWNLGQSKEDTFEICDPFYRRILRRLHDAPGRCLPIAAFRTDAVSIVQFDAGDATIYPMLVQFVMRGFLEGYWYVLGNKPAFESNPNDMPKVDSVIRWQVTRGASVTNRLHRPVKLTPEERELIALLDGKTSRDTVSEKLKMLRAEVDLAIERFAKEAVFEPKD